MLVLFCSYFFVLLSYATSEDVQQPNIVFIVADDLGWGDVSFHGSDQIMTPNIDMLAYQGTVLQNYYTDSQGTAARSSLFTGKYAMRLGTQSDSIAASEDRGIPLTERLLPEYLQDLGYSTHLVGKWSLGKSREHYLPTKRGFDSFYGFLDKAVDYFTYNLIESRDGNTYFGLNLFENLQPVEDQSGHLTQVLTDKAVQIIKDHNSTGPLYLHVSHAAPHAGGALVNLQPPADSIAANDHIAHSARRLYAGLVTSLDRSVGNIIAALAEKEILYNTIIAFVSDNGAATIGEDQNFGSNLPLRGKKNTPWEGASRSIGILWHSSMPGKIWDGIFHVSDWLPTLVDAGGSNETIDVIDGVSQWNAIVGNQRSQRKDVLITLDDLNGYAAYRDGDFKIVVGDVALNISSYYGDDLKDNRIEAPLYESVILDSETYRVFKETLEMPFDINAIFMKRNDTSLMRYQYNLGQELCVPNHVKGCLYNISEDPLEINDVWHLHPDILQHMTLRLRTLWAEIKSRYHSPPDPRSNPALHDYIWYSWIPNEEIKVEPIVAQAPFPLQISKGELQYMVDINVNMFKDQLYVFIKNMSDSFIKSVSSLFTL